MASTHPVLRGLVLVFLRLDWRSCQDPLTQARRGGIPPRKSFPEARIRGWSIRCTSYAKKKNSGGSNKWQPSASDGDAFSY